MLRENSQIKLSEYANLYDAIRFFEMLTFLAPSHNKTNVVPINAPHELIKISTKLITLPGTNCW